MMRRKKEKRVEKGRKEGDYKRKSTLFVHGNEARVYKHWQERKRVYHDVESSNRLKVYFGEIFCFRFSLTWTCYYPLGSRGLVGYVHVQPPPGMEMSCTNKVIFELSMFNSELQILSTMSLRHTDNPRRSLISKIVCIRYVLYGCVV